MSTSALAAMHNDASLPGNTLVRRIVAITALSLGPRLAAAPSLEAQSRPTPTAAGTSATREGRDDVDRVAGWRSDLDSLVAIVRARHWRFREAPLPPDFLERARQIRDGIPRMSDDDVVVKFQALLATLHDGHTLLYPFGMKRGGLSHLPLGMYEFQDGLAVISTDSANAPLLGRRIRAIEGTPVPDVVKRLAPFLSLENTSQLRWAYPTYLTFPAFLRAAGLTVEAQGVRMTIDSGTGWMTTVVRPTPPPLDPGTLTLGLQPVPAARGGRGPLYLSRLQDAYWFTTLDDGATVYLQVNRIASDSADPLARFAARLLDSLVQPRTRTLIVDLRTNSGGNAAVLPPLIRTIVAYRALRPAARIFLVIGRQTFSAAQTLVNRLEEYCGPVVVGEESGSKPNRFGNGVGFRLPYSGVRGEVSSGYNQAATSRDDRAATVADVRVGLTLRDWLAGRDPAMDTIAVLTR